MFNQLLTGLFDLVLFPFRSLDPMWGLTVISFLAGILMHVHGTGSIEFVHMPWGWGGEYLAYNLMLLGFIINSATTPFHSWLSDTYSEATPSGSVYMTAYTTKTAVFCLIMTFSGVERSRSVSSIRRINCPPWWRG